MTENQNFTMVSGDTKVIEVTVDSVDLSGASIKWIMHQFGAEKVRKETPGTITVTDAVGGLLQIKLDPTDTASLVGDYSHEMEVTDAAGNVSTVMSGRVSVQKGYV